MSRKSNRVKVCVRIRPLLKKDFLQPGGKNAWSCHENILYQRIFPPVATSTKESPSSYKFDHVYTSSSTTQAIYDDNVKDMVIAAMEGYHSSVLAYGQIGSGKSYTMQGNVGEHGIISFALQNVFEFIDTHPEMDFLLRLSYLEIFHEKIYDLLASGAKSDIRIYEFVAEDSDEKDIKDIIIKGAREEIVTSFQHAWSLVKEGNFHRHMGITENNQKSSQSHTILRIMIESQEIENQGIRLSSPVRTSTLSLVDLVGSECLEPQRMDRSLATLDEIITIMSQAPHNQRLTSIAADFPFGNSKLTRLLQPSLSGKAQVAIICTIIPSMECLDETHNTLKFASRAHRLRHHASINKTVSNVAALKKYRETIHHLENQLEELELRRCQIIAAHNEGNIYGGVQAKLNLSTIMEREVELKHTIMRFNRAILHSSQRDLKLVPPHNNQENSTEEHDKDETASQTPDNEIFKRTSSSQTICINHDVRSSYDEAVNQVKPEPQEYQTKFSYSDLPSHSKVTSILKGRSMKLLAQLQSQDQIQEELHLTKLTLLRDIVHGLEITEAEQEARLSKLHDLEEQNQYLRSVLHARERELMALKKVSMENETF